MRLPTDTHKWPRLYMAAALADGNRLVLTADQSHYLLHVLRLQDGSPVRVFNAAGEWRADLTIIGANKKATAFLTVAHQLKTPLPEPDLWLCCAPIKRAHFDFVVMKATELGVTCIQPILTARTQVREINLERCTTIAIEAAEQSERCSLPVIVEPLTLDKLIAAWPVGRLPVVCAEFGNAQPVHTSLTQPVIKNTASTAIITGPEGGFTPEEMTQLQQLPHALPVRLGPRILRADTAALAAISCWQALCGDWRELQITDRM